MNALGQETYLVELFSKEICNNIIESVKKLPQARWFHRPMINSLPTKGSKDADYYFLGNRQMPEDLYRYLDSLAPSINGFRPTEICINKYLPGGFMSEHIDQNLAPLYTHNMVVQLSDYGDGITIDGTFIKDVPGNAIILPAISPPHEVTPVKHERYIMICLYEGM